MILLFLSFLTVSRAETAPKAIPSEIQKHLQVCLQEPGTEFVSDIIKNKYLGETIRERRIKSVEELIGSLAKTRTNQIRDEFCKATVLSKDNPDLKRFNEFDNGKSIFDNDNCKPRGLDGVSKKEVYGINIIDLTDPAHNIEQRMNAISYLLACEKALIQAFNVTPKILATNKLSLRENSDGSLTIEHKNAVTNPECPNPMTIPKPVACVFQQLRVIRKVGNGISVGVKPNPMPEMILPEKMPSTIPKVGK